MNGFAAFVAPISSMFMENVVFSVVNGDGVPLFFGDSVISDLFVVGFRA